MSRRSTRALRLGLLGLGLALFCGLILGLDTGALLAHLAGAGWVLAPAFGAYVLNLACAAMAWRETIEPGEHGRRAPFMSTLAAFWAGHAVNGVGVGAMGEVVKGTLLARRVRGDEVAASLVVYGFLNAATMVAATVIGPAVCLVWLDLPTEVVAALFAVSAVLVVGMVALRGILARGVAGGLVRTVARLPFVGPRDAERWGRAAEVVDRRVREFRTRHPGSFRRAVAWCVGSRVLQTVEWGLLLYALLPSRDPGFLALLALLSQSANQLVGWAASLIPAQMGAMEGGSALLYSLLGLGAELGLSLAVLRRIRRVAGIGAGLLIALWIELRARGTRAPPSPPPDPCEIH